MGNDLSDQERIITVLDRIRDRGYTQHDIAELLALSKAGEAQGVLQIGNKNLYVGQVTGDEVQIGNRIYLGADAETIRKVFQEVLVEHRSVSSGNVRGAIQNFQRDYLISFGGRRKELTELDSWLAQTEKTIGMLIAPAGRGKSALLANWIQHLEDENKARVVYHPISMRHKTNDRDGVLRSLISQLGQFIEDSDTDGRDPGLSESRLASYLYTSPSPGLPLVVVVDGLDELNTAPDEYLSLPGHVASGIHLLISARGDSESDRFKWRDRLQWQEAPIEYFDLDLLDESEIVDLVQQSGLSVEPQAMRSLVKQIYRLSNEGDPLIASLLIRHLKDQVDAGIIASITLEVLESLRLDELDPGMGSYIDRVLEQLEQSGVTTESLFDALCMARGPLMESDLRAIGAKVEKVLPYEMSLLSGQLIMVVYDEQQHNRKQWGLVFSHPRIGSAYAGKLTQERREKWITRFRAYGADALREALAGKTTKVPDYVLRHYKRTFTLR